MACLSFNARLRRAQKGVVWRNLTLASEVAATRPTPVEMKNAEFMVQLPDMA